MEGTGQLVDDRRWGVGYSRSARWQKSGFHVMRRVLRFHYARRVLEAVNLYLGTVFEFNDSLLSVAFGLWVADIFILPSECASRGPQPAPGSWPERVWYKLLLVAFGPLLLAWNPRWHRAPWRWFKFLAWRGAFCRTYWTQADASEER